MNRNLLMEYINLRLKQEEIVEPYFKLLRNNDLFEMLRETAQFTRRVIGVSEPEEELINSFIDWKSFGYDKAWMLARHHIETTEQLANFIINMRSKDNEYGE